MNVEREARELYRKWETACSWPSCEGKDGCSIEDCRCFVTSIAAALRRAHDAGLEAAAREGDAMAVRWQQTGEELLRQGFRNQTALDRQASVSELTAAIRALKEAPREP